MRVKVDEKEHKTIIKQLGYDTFFICLEILDKLEITSDFNSNVVLSDMVLEENKCNFSLNNDDFLIKLNVVYTNDRSQFYITVFKGRDVNGYLYNNISKKLLIKEKMYYGHNVLLKKTTNYQNKKIIYEAYNYKIGQNIIIKMNHLEKDQLIIAYLLHNSLIYDTMIDFIKIVINKEQSIKIVHTNLVKNIQNITEMNKGIVKQYSEKIKMKELIK